MEKENMESVQTTRRKMLKETGKKAAFILPVIVSFRISKLHAQASSKPQSLPEPPDPPIPVD
jgi:hypothetical protein